MHRQKQTMGYGVMVTLQILVLSFLVRIQVAQLKRSSSEGRFFVVSTGDVVGGALKVRLQHLTPWHQCKHRAKESNARQPRLSTTHIARTHQSLWCCAT